MLNQDGVRSPLQNYNIAYVLCARIKVSLLKSNLTAAEQKTGKRVTAAERSDGFHGLARKINNLVHRKTLNFLKNLFH
jgi:hypothetical protein